MPVYLSLGLLPVRVPQPPITNLPACCYRTEGWGSRLYSAGSHWAALFPRPRPCDMASQPLNGPHVLCVFSHLLLARMPGFLLSGS